MSKKNAKKSIMEQVMSEIRLPVAPPACAHKNKKDKRVKKFNYKTELHNY